MNWFEVFNRFEYKYWADSGLCRLDPYPDTALDHTILYGIETCNNENGILFLAFTLVAAFEKGNTEQRNKILSYKPRIELIIKSLQRLDVPGLYNRQPKHNVRSEAHDDYVGIATLCDLYSIKEPVQGMINWAWSHKLCFNNVEPERFSWAQFRQPGEIALYYIAAKIKSPFLFTLWLLIGLFLSAYKKQEPGQTQLAWLRLWLIDRVDGPEGTIQKFLYKKLKSYWLRKLAFNYSSIQNVQALYFKEDHPVVLFNKL